MTSDADIGDLKSCY